MRRSKNCAQEFSDINRGGGTCHNLGGPKIKWVTLDCEYKFFDFHVAMYA